MSLFFEERKAEREGYSTAYQAQPVILWKCGRCFVNLPTEGVKSNTVSCTHCGAENSLAEIRWSGQKS